MVCLQLSLRSIYPTTLTGKRAFAFALAAMGANPPPIRSLLTQPAQAMMPHISRTRTLIILLLALILPVQGIAAAFAPVHRAMNPNTMTAMAAMPCHTQMGEHATQGGDHAPASTHQQDSDIAPARLLSSGDECGVGRAGACRRAQIRRCVAICVAAGDTLYPRFSRPPAARLILVSANQDGGPLEGRPLGVRTSQPVTRITMFRYLHYAVWLAAVWPMAHAAEPAKDLAVKMAAPPRPAATEASAPVPATPYNSAFTGYQPYREQNLAPWRALNDEVHKAGGHIGIFGGAAGNAPGTRSPASATSAHPAEHKK